MCAQYTWSECSGDPSGAFSYLRALPWNASAWSCPHPLSHSQGDIPAPSTIPKAYVSKCHEECAAWDKPKFSSMLIVGHFFYQNQFQTSLLSWSQPPLPQQSRDGPHCRSPAFHSKDKSGWGQTIKRPKNKIIISPLNEIVPLFPCRKTGGFLLK